MHGSSALITEISRVGTQVPTSALTPKKTKKTL